MKKFRKIHERTLSDICRSVQSAIEKARLHGRPVPAERIKNLQRAAEEFRKAFVAEGTLVNRAYCTTKKHALIKELLEINKYLRQHKHAAKSPNSKLNLRRILSSELYISNSQFKL